MKKIIAMLAALTLMCSSVVLPAVSAECISYKEINAYSDEYFSEKVTENGLVFNVYDGYAYLTDCEDTDITEVTIPEKVGDTEVVGVDGTPFGYCRKLESITLPDTLKYFTWQSLIVPTVKLNSNEDPLPTLKEIKVSETNPNFTVHDGVLFTKDMKTVVGCPPALSYSTSSLPKETETIGVFAFMCNLSLQNAIIPENIKTVQMSAFKGCVNLKSVELPKSVTEIQAETFTYCKSLNSVKINGKLTAIGAFAFSQCESLKKFTIPDSVTYLGWNPFEDSGCIEVEDNVYYVGKWCVGGDKNRITELSFREGTVGVAEMSFILANRINELYIPSGVKYLGTMFYQASRGELMRIRMDCNTLNKDDLKGAKKIKDIYIYSYNCKIEDDEATIPAKWKYVEDNTDYDYLIKHENDEKGTSSGNSASQSINAAVNTTLIDLDEEKDNAIPDTLPYTHSSVIAADEKAAVDADGLTEGDVVIHGSKGSTAEAYAKKYNRPFEIIRDLPYDKDAEHEKFTEGDFEYMTDGEYAWLNACVNKDIKEAVIPEKVNGMCVVGLVPDNRDNYFKGCTKLEKLTLNQHISPSDLSYMGTEDSPLKAYEIPPENDSPDKVIDGVVYSISGKGIMKVPNGIEGEFVIPDQVEFIGSGAFRNCKKITSVKMSDNLTQIGFDAFEGCTSLKNVKLPEGLKSIAENAFPENAYDETVDGLNYVDGWLVASDESVREKDSIVIKDGTVGTANEALGLKFGAELTIPASIKDDIPYAYHFSGPKTVHYYPSCGYDKYLSSQHIADVFIYDPECDLSDCSINKHYPDSEESVFPNQNNNTVIHGYAGSTAEKYAEANNMPFELIKDVSGKDETVSLKKAKVLRAKIYDNRTELTVKGYDKPFIITAQDGKAQEIYAGDTVTCEFTLNADGNYTTAKAAEINSMGGDTNCDNSIDMGDAVLIMQALANPSKYGESGTDKNHITSQGTLNADIYGDDGMTNLDALAIQRRLLHLD